MLYLNLFLIFCSAISYPHCNSLMKSAKLKRVKWSRESHSWRNLPFIGWIEDLNSSTLYPQNFRVWSAFTHPLPLLTNFIETVLTEESHISESIPLYPLSCTVHSQRWRTLNRLSPLQTQISSLHPSPTPLLPTNHTPLQLASWSLNVAVQSSIITHQRWRWRWSTGTG